MVSPGDLAATLQVCAVLILIGDGGCRAQEAPEKKNPNQPAYNYPNNNQRSHNNYAYYSPGNEGYQYPSYEHNEYNDYNGYNSNGGSSMSYIQCFACVYQVRAGHKSGMDNCNDPFVPTDIPSVDCKGPCGKIFHQLSESDFSVSRVCIPNCKEHRDANSYTQCCSISQCNSATSYRVLHSHRLLLSFTIAAVILWLTR